MTSPLPNLLQRTADLLRLSGVNEFKAVAWDRAAGVVEREGESLRLRTSEAELQELPNIGKSLAAQIHHYLREGALPELESLERRLPAGLMDWLDIPGLGPKRAAKIHQALEIDTLEDLKAALEDGRVAGLPGFGAKSAGKILNALTWMEGNTERCRLDEAMELAEAVLEALKDHPGLRRLETAGSLRRGRETIGDLDFLACAEDPASLHAAFRSLPEVTGVLVQGETKTSVRVEAGRQMDLRTVSEAEFAAALIYFTGGKEHNVFLRGRARERGMTLNEYGLYPLRDGEPDRERPVACASEREVYRALDLPFTPPELREEPYRAWVEADDLPKLVKAEDLRGVLHAHSDWSDGRHGLEDMARACMDLGYGYLGITDHSKSAFYANGLDAKRVEAQWREIDHMNARFRDEGKEFRIFKGIESDILSDGSLDYPGDLLAGFEFVIASLHGQLDMAADAMRERVETAVRNPHTTLLGHPTARLLLQRPGVKLNMEPVIRLAAEHGVAIELNAAPARLELDWRWGRLARETGLLTAICPDAHAKEDLARTTRFGIPAARKSGFDALRVLNTFPTESLAERWR